MQRQRHHDRRLVAVHQRRAVLRARLTAKAPDRRHEGVDISGSERGDTLIEVLIAVVIIALAVVPLLGALVTSLTGSAEHRSLAAIDTVLKSFAEAAKYDIQLQPVTPTSAPLFKNCATTTSYRIVSMPSPTSGPVGTAVTVFGTGYDANSPLTVAIGSPIPSSDVISGASSDGNGNVGVTFTVPAGATSGQVTVSETSKPSVSATSTDPFTVSSGTPVSTSSPLAGYTIGISLIGWWNGSGFDSPPAPCSTADQSGVQRITLLAAAPNNVSDTLDFVVLNPGTVTSVITSSASTTFTVGTAGTFTVTSTGFPTPTVSESGSLPSGVSFNAATGVLSGTPAAGTGGTYPITFTATNSAGPPFTQPFTLTVNQAPVITSVNQTTFTVGTAGTFTVTTTGFPAPTLTNANFTGCTTSTLPSGVTFTANSNGTATLAGTPGAGTGRTYALCLNASNGVNPNATQSFTLTVDQAPVITSVNQTTFTVGTAGTFTVTTTGFPAPTLTNANFTGCTTSTLPSGVTFTANSNGTATLAGTPGAGTGRTYALCLNASNGVNPNATQSFTLTVDQAPVITSANKTTFRHGHNGNFPVTATGFPTPTLSESGSLPSGVSFNAATSVLSGTPAAGTQGTYHLTFAAANGVNPNFIQNFTLTVS
jgi:hypothetical protein